MSYNKHRNIITRANGYVFRSKLEAKRYAELLLLERAKEITDLEVHPRFPLQVSGEDIAIYEADFFYRDNGISVVEDVKGRRAGTAYQLYKIKAKLMLAIYGIKVQEITK